MTTIVDSLKAINAYPIPQRTINDVMSERGLLADTEATEEVRASANYNLAKADLYKWLGSAPNISHSGRGYSFSEAERISFRNEAAFLYKEYCSDGDRRKKSRFGYKGSKQ